jgi:hypothetical protein
VDPLARDNLAYRLAFIRHFDLIVNRLAQIPSVIEYLAKHPVALQDGGYYNKYLKYQSKLK